MLFNLKVVWEYIVALRWHHYESITYCVILPTTSVLFLGFVGSVGGDKVSTWLQNITRDRQRMDVCKRVVDDL